MKNKENPSEKKAQEELITSNYWPSCKESSIDPVAFSNIIKNQIFLVKNSITLTKKIFEPEKKV